LRAEVEVMQQLGVSLNAVHLHDVFEDDVNVHMVMELCEGGALLERVESGRYSERYISFLVRSILRFIAQCHAKVRCGRADLRLHVLGGVFAAVGSVCGCWESATSVL
jgi:serine/threonine protein kinase